MAFSWFKTPFFMVQRGDPCEIMKMRDFMVQDPCEIIWFSDFTWLNYENGPFDGSQPHFHGSAIAMSSQVHDARYLLALLMDILLCNVLMLSTSVASSGIIGGMQKSSYSLVIWGLIDFKVIERENVLIHVALHSNVAVAFLR